MSALRMHTMLMTSAFLAGIGAAARAQDCASAPLLGGRVAAGAELSHSTLGETGLGASLNGRVIGTLRVGGAYRATRLDDVDRLAHQGSVLISAPVSLAGFDVCPIAGAAYSHLATDRSTMRGYVVTREERAGLSLARRFAVTRAGNITPFVEPIVVSRRVSWESVDTGWRIAGVESARETQLWLGVSLATSRSAVVTRFRPKRASAPQEAEIGIVTALGSR
jgi:hypothetical protein